MLLAFLRSAGYALEGLIQFFRTERNGKIQLFMGCAAVCMSVTLHISHDEWIAILLCIALVLSLEMLNSALEKLCNLVQPDVHPAIKLTKDLAAGAVLWSALISLIIGCFIFIPRFKFQYYVPITGG